MQCKDDRPLVAYCPDRKFLLGTLVSLYSMLKKRAGAVEILVAHDGVSSEQLGIIRDVAELFPNADLRIQDASQYDAVVALDPEQWRPGHISRASMIRMLLPLMESRRILYIDGDTIIRADVQDLYHADLDGKPLGGCVDAFFLSLYHRRMLFRKILGQGEGRCAAARSELHELRRHEGYINSGVLVMESGKLMSRRYRDAWLDLKAAAALEFPDQDRINMVLRGNIKLLDPRWNSNWGNRFMASPLMPRAQREAYAASVSNPAIVHFCGAIKPWSKSLNTRIFSRWAREYRALQSELSSRVDLTGAVRLVA